MKRTRPVIALLSLGGTIGARVDRRGRDAALALDASDFLASLPELADIADIRPRAFRTLMSADLTSSDILSLAAEIAHLAAEGIDGVVVTQGTDTIEETAYLLDLVLPLDIPLVVTGAMRNPGKPGEDGPANLMSAVRVAVSPDASGLGVVVTLDDTVHLARFVRKSHSFSTGAFTSQPLGPVGYVVEDRVRILLRPLRRPAAIDVGGTASLPPVALMTASLDDDARLLPALPGSGYRGLVFEALGAGHVPQAVVKALETVNRTMPVVFATRTRAGDLYRISGTYPGSEGDLLSRGLISAGSLDAIKSRILLSVLLTKDGDRQTIADTFEDTGR